MHFMHPQNPLATMPPTPWTAPASHALLYQGLSHVSGLLHPLCRSQYGGQHSPAACCHLGVGLQRVLRLHGRPAVPGVWPAVQLSTGSLRDTGFRSGGTGGTHPRRRSARHAARRAAGAAPEQARAQAQGLGCSSSHQPAACARAAAQQQPSSGAAPPALQALADPWAPGRRAGAPLRQGPPRKPPSRQLPRACRSASRAPSASARRHITNPARTLPPTPSCPRPVSTRPTCVLCNPEGFWLCLWTTGTPSILHSDGQAWPPS